MYKIIFICSLLVLISAAPQVFVTRRFKTGIEYENSLPMSGGSDRYKHRNNLEPFYITVTASAKNITLSTRAGIEPGKNSRERLGCHSDLRPENILKLFATFKRHLSSCGTFKNYMISYLDITTITDEEGEVEFNLVRGGTGSRTAVFQLISNNTEFLTYSYLVYGIRDDEYKKVTANFDDR